MELIDRSFERLAKDLLSTEMTTLSASTSAVATTESPTTSVDTDESAIVLDDDTILIDPMKNVPLRVVSDISILYLVARFISYCHRLTTAFLVLTFFIYLYEFA